MDLINQQLVVKEWPLKKPGDAKFFGYVVAMGAFPRDWTDDGMIVFVDFAYSERYERYRLPNDEGLRKQLPEQLEENMAMYADYGDIYGKVWVTLTEKGYKVDQP